MSALSWVMQTAFALHLPTIFARHKAKDAPLRDPGEFAIAMFKNIYPKVTTDDYDKFRFQIVKQYMLDPATDDFRPEKLLKVCLLYTSPSPRDRTRSRMPSSA